MPSGYEQSPDCGGRPPLDRHRVVAAIIYATAIGIIVWLAW